MELLQITIVLLLLMGVFLVFYSYGSLKNKGENQNKNKNNNKNKKKLEQDYYKYDEMFKMLNGAIEEANKFSEDLNKLATDIFEELDNKHQELMVIYKLIQEKSQNSENIKVESTNNMIDNTNEVIKVNNIENEKEFKINIENNLGDNFESNTKKDEIMSLRRQGLSIEDIAKKLDLGKGEVQLIIDFGEVIHE